MATQFVNPLPKALLTGYISFDFPCCGVGDAPGAYTGHLPNYNVSALGTYGTIQPAIEAYYGPLGNPPKEQGHPRIQEYGVTQPSDPSEQDQVLDHSREILIEHTGRLSGTGLSSFINPLYKLTVKMYALPTIAGGSALPLNGPPFLEYPLHPIGSPGVKQWFWKEGIIGSEEILFTAQAIVTPSAVSLLKENTYKLIVKWEFWDYTAPTPEVPRKRMLMSGFDEEISFEVTSL